MIWNRRSWIVVPTVVLFCSLLGGILGPEIANVAAASEDDANINSAVKTFSNVYALVEENFADKIAPEKAVYNGAIPGMLRTLDPHSSFFDPRDFQLLREDQKGHYYGVGMTVAPRERQDHRDRAVPRLARLQGRHPARRRRFSRSTTSRPRISRTDEVADLLEGTQGHAGAGDDRAGKAPPTRSCSTSPATRFRARACRMPSGSSRASPISTSSSSTRTPPAKSRRTSSGWAKRISRA